MNELRTDRPGLGLMRKVPLAEHAVVADDGTLRRTLGPVSLTMIGVSNAIGAGIFILTGTAAATYAGPAVAISFLLAGFVCLLTALCYGELSAMMPDAGGSYVYARVALGWSVAWLVGWCMVLEYLVAGATVAVGWSAYAAELAQLVGWHFPPRLSGSPIMIGSGGEIAATGQWINLPAILIVLACTVVLARGIRGSARFNAVMVSIKVTVILLVILAGAQYVETANWQPFIPPNQGSFGAFGYSGVVTAAAVAFFSYSGFEALSTSAREARNPRRDVPTSLLAALGICAVLYVAMALVVTGLVDYKQLNVASPVTTALRAAGGGLDWLLPIVGVGTVVGLASVVMISLYGQSRVFFAMASRGDMPAIFAKVSPNARVPVQGTWIVGLAAAAVAGLLPLAILGELVSMGCLLAFASVCASMLILRITHPDVPRSFRVPYGRTVAFLGLISCLTLTLSLPTVTWVAIAIWIAAGLALFTVRVLGQSRGARTTASAPR